MSKNYLTCLFVLLTAHCLGQTVVHDTLIIIRKEKTFSIKDLSIGLPDITMAYCQPLRDKSLRGMPAGEGQFFYPTSGTVGVPILNCGMKLAGVYYKEKYGIELHYGQYGPTIHNTEGYNNYLAMVFPNYYSSTNFYPLYGVFNYFDGFLLGPTYKMQWQKFVLTPKLLVGIVNYGNTESFFYQLKEKGNNQFVNYDVTNTIPGHAHDFPSMHAELDMARKVRCKDKHFKCEIGLRLEYMMIPYKQQEAVTQQTNNGPISTQEWSSRHVFQMVSTGAYLSLFYTKKHPPEEPIHLFRKKKKNK